MQSDESKKIDQPKVELPTDEAVRELAAIILSTYQHRRGLPYSDGTLSCTANRDGEACSE